jgi:hypothetical protein
VRVTWQEIKQMLLEAKEIFVTSSHLEYFAKISKQKREQIKRTISYYV